MGNRSDQPEPKSGRRVVVTLLLLLFFLLLFFLFLLLFLLRLGLFVLLLFLLFFFRRRLLLLLLLFLEDVAAGLEEPDFVAPEEGLERGVVAGGGEAVGVDGQVAGGGLDQVEQGLLLVVPVGLFRVAAEGPDKNDTNEAMVKLWR